MQVIETHPYEQLSHAVLAWLQQNLGRCDVVHAHEWGGVFVDAITANAYRQLKPGAAQLLHGHQAVQVMLAALTGWKARAGLRVVVESHGGHFWSTQGQAQRPLDVVSLRIDVQERMTLQLADALISPTHYMTAFLRQRGWRLPATSLVVPNVLPELEAAGRLVAPSAPRTCLFMRHCGGAH